MDFNLPGIAGVSWVFVYWGVTAIVHAIFSIGVFQDVKRQNKLFDRGVLFANGWVWALATLLGGVVVVGIYWAIHHSTLRPENLHTIDKSNI